MKKCMGIMGCALVALMVGTAVVAWSGEDDEEEYEGMTEEIWCEITACTADDTGADEETGWGLLSDPPAWGCCEFQHVPDGTTRCFCEEPVPGGGAPVSATAFYVGRNGAKSDPYTLLAVKGTKSGSTWSYSVCGGCQKQYMDRLLVWGIDSASYGSDNIKFINGDVTYGNGVFTSWWSSQDYWLSATAAGRGGNDKITGSPQSDILYGGSGDDIIWGGRGDDKLYGVSGNNYLYGQNGVDRLFGGADTDYCDCGGGEADGNCDTKVNCDN